MSVCGVCASGGKSGVWGPQQTHVLLPRHPPPAGWGAADLSGKFGGFIPAAAVRGPLVLAAGARPCHEVPRGGIRPQTHSVSRPPGRVGRELEKQQPLAFIKFPVSKPRWLSQPASPLRPGRPHGACHPSHPYGKPEQCPAAPPLGEEVPHFRKENNQK